MRKNALITLAVPLVLISMLAHSGDDSNCSVSAIPQPVVELGCGCSYERSESTAEEYHPILQSDLAFQKPLMFIQGELVSLDAVYIEQIPSNATLGDTFKQTYEHAGDRYVFTNRITFLCPANSESCEVTSFSAVLGINDTCRMELVGHCGC